MDQHPVPQHIASYEFRLVGDMTLKQFGMLAGSCLVALLFYALPIPGYFKWPLVIFFVLLGIGLAFLPIEERPLHRWLIAFFKAVYLPTQFVWKKQARKPEVFEPVSVKKTAPQKPVLPPDRGQLGQYLQTLPALPTPFEQEEESFLKKVTNLFHLTKLPSTVPLTTPPSQIKARIQSIPSAPIKPKEPLPPPLPTKPPLPKRTIKKEPFELKIKPEKREPAVEAKISPELPFPQTPRTPNLLVGMVLDHQGKIIEDAIIEIRDSQEIPVRALKTNKLGQFLIVTPLKNDTYEIETEKDGFSFDIVKVELRGKPVSPIEIRAKESKASPPVREVSKK